MTIAIIGSGNIGGTLTRRLRQLGHDVVVANSRGPASLTALAAETGADTATVEDAVGRSDTVIVAIPLKAVPDLPTGIWTGKTVVDANNYYPSRDGTIDAIEGGTPSSVWVAQHVDGATVVKAFNTIWFQHLSGRGAAAGTEGRMAIPVAGEGPEAAAVRELVEALGFDAVDGGTLEQSWRQEPGRPAYGTESSGAQLAELLAATTR